MYKRELITNYDIGLPEFEEDYLLFYERNNRNPVLLKIGPQLYEHMNALCAAIIMMPLKGKFDLWVKRTLNCDIVVENDYLTYEFK